MSKRKDFYKYSMGIVSVILLILTFQGMYNYVAHKQEIEICFVSKTDDERFVFWEMMRMGAELAAKELGVQLTYVGPKDENSAEEQYAVVETVLEADPDVLIVSPIDKEVLKKPIEKAKQQGIILVGVDSTTEQIEHNVATDNVEAAITLMQHLGNLIGGRGTVAVLNFQADATTARDREKGCIEAARAFKDIKLLPTTYVDGEVFAAYEAAKKLLSNNPSINGIFCTNQYMTEGAYLAVSELELMEKVKVVGFDSSRLVIEGIEKDGIEGVMVQKPFNMGYMSVRTAVELLRGKKTPEKIDIDYKFVTKQDIYETENQKLLYPIVK